MVINFLPNLIFLRLVRRQNTHLVDSNLLSLQDIIEHFHHHFHLVHINQRILVNLLRPRNLYKSHIIFRIRPCEASNLCPKVVIYAVAQLVLIEINGGEGRNAWVQSILNVQLAGFQALPNESLIEGNGVALKKIKNK